MTDKPINNPVIAIAGLPRVGSMWGYNVVRSLLQCAGFKVVPESIPTSDKDMLLAAEAHTLENPSDIYCVIKVHALLPDLPSLKVIYGVRDLHDGIYSLCRFMNKPLDEKSAVGMVREKALVDSHYGSWTPDRIMYVPFEDIEINSKDLIRKIAEFIELPEICADYFDEIDHALKKDRVKKMVDDLNHRAFGSRKEPGEESLEIVHGYAGSVRAFDRKTGFQSGHVSDYCPGDWRHL